jgi:hypothetical protein
VEGIAEKDHDIGIVIRERVIGRRVPEAERCPSRNCWHSMAEKTGEATVRNFEGTRMELVSWSEPLLPLVKTRVTSPSRSISRTGMLW